jgi:heat shock protein HslJ
MVVALCACTIAGCASGTSSPSSSSGQAGAPASLVGPSWELASYRGPSEAMVAVAAPASLVFGAAGALTGTTGCNSFSGSYTVHGSALTLSLGAMTTKACLDPAAMAQETALTQLLPTVTGYTLAGASLSLSAPGGSTVAVYHVGLTGLPGSSWTVTGVNNGRGAVESTPLTEQLTASFAADGSFHGFGGCNQLSGSYTTSGGNGVTIGPLAATRKTCGADVDQLEAAYTAALGRVATYDISGHTLTLRDRGGATQVTASAGP